VPFYAESEQTDLDPDIGLLPDPQHWDLFDRVLFRSAPLRSGGRYWHPPCTLSNGRSNPR
jgi:hypothetical protein